VSGFRKQQDVFLQRLVEQWGIQPINATTPPIQNLLGESKRNEKIFGVRAQLKKG
jgi:hypothetical protein